MDTKPANLSLVDPEIEIGRRAGERIERRAIVGDRGRETAIG